MVAPALMVASMNIPGTPPEWQQLPPESAVLLVEFGASSDDDLSAGEAAALEAVGEANLIRPAEFTATRKVELDWRVREGLHGLIGRLRPPGTALIVEDVCVPPPRIADAAKDLQALLGEHGFLTGVAGHASAGNLHFMLTPDFAKPEDLARYEAFMEGLVELVLGKYDGSLKAEHGTGINMAPYVEREWGERATELMWRVKELADPDAVLGPGVVLNRDPGVHLRNLMTTPEIEEVANHCVECGFCEPACPSHDLTTTPRQRIVLRREIARQPAASPVAAALEREYEYDGLETCAADGTCALACPLSIDTGKLVKELRAQRALRHSGARRRPGRTELALGRAGVRAPGCGPGRSPSGSGAASCRRPAPRLPARRARGRRGRLLPLVHQPHHGPLKRAGPGPTVPDALVAVSARAGMPVWIPPDVAGFCCGVPCRSKGHRGAHAGWPRQHVRDALALVRRRRAAGRERRELVHAWAHERGGRGSARGVRGAPREARDPRLGRVAGARVPTLGGRATTRAGRDPSDLRHTAPRPDPPLSGAGRPAGRRGGGPDRGDLLRVRGRPGHAAPGTDRIGDGATGAPSSPSADRSTPTSRPTARARSAWSAPPASPTSRSSRRWRG